MIVFSEIEIQVRYIQLAREAYQNLFDKLGRVLQLKEPSDLKKFAHVKIIIILSVFSSFFFSKGPYSLW